MEGKGEEKRNQGGKLVAKEKSGSEERLIWLFQQLQNLPSSQMGGFK